VPGAEKQPFYFCDAFLLRVLEVNFDMWRCDIIFGYSKLKNSHAAQSYLVALALVKGEGFSVE